MAWTSSRTVPAWITPGPAPRRDQAEKIISVVAAVALAAATAPLLMSTPHDAATSGRQAGNPSATDVAAPETIVAGYGGVTHTQASDVHFTKSGVTDLTAHRVEWIGRPFKSPIYYGVRVMHGPAVGSFGGMVDFTHAKASARREQTVTFSGTRNGKPADGSKLSDATFRHLEFSHGHNMLTLNGLFRLHRLLPMFRPYVGAGAGIALPHTEVQFRDEPRRTYEYQITGVVGQAVAGIEIRLPHSSVLLEYKFSLAPYWVPLSERDGRKGNAFIDYWNQITSWLSGKEPPGGNLTTTLATHHAIVAVGYRHVGAPAPTPAAPR
ncbi:MAG: hypothetical protein ACK5JT_05715 [Hyphomicrobiaceae bacterium]